MEGVEPEAAVALSVAGVSKRYGDALVLDAVDLRVGPGEVHALLGENGAGKSTLIKIVAGVVTPDAGGVAIAGRPMRLGSPHAAQQAGVSTLFQELATVPGLSVAENVFLGWPVPARLGVVRRRALEASARALFAKLGQSLDVRRDVATLSPVEQTMTALARALSHEARVLILDEPTAALTDAETSVLFAAIERLRDDGTAIVYVSHRLDEVFRVATRFTVLRNGRVVTSGDLSSVSVSAVITAMAGRPVDAVFPAWTPRSVDPPSPSVLLRAVGLTGRRLRDVSLEIAAGEVVGIAGLAGSGRSELVRILGGASRARSGSLEIGDRRVRPRGPGQAHRIGVVHVPQERRSQGLVPDSVERNLTLTTIDRHTIARVVASRRRERRFAGRLWERFDVRGHGLAQAVLTLSGGNQQKVVLARFLALEPRVLLLDEPTRGIDVATKSDVYRLIREQAAAGRGVLVVSSELPELLGVCDRILVLHEGRLAGTFGYGEATEAQLLHACYGHPA